MSGAEAGRSRDVSTVRPAVRVAVGLAGAVVLVAWSLGATLETVPVVPFVVLTALGVAARVARHQRRGPALDIALVFVGAMTLIVEPTLAVWGAALVALGGVLSADARSRAWTSVATLTLAQSAAVLVRSVAEDRLVDQAVLGAGATGPLAVTPFGVGTALVTALTLAVAWDAQRWLTTWLDRRVRADGWRARAEARWLLDLSLAGTAVVLAVAWSQYPPLVLLLVVPLLTVWRLVAAPAGRVAATGGFDDLTGLGDATVMRAVASEELGRADQFDRPTAVLMVDVDGLGRTSLLHGQEAGDEAVRTVARAIRAAVRPYDVVTRLNDHAFALLLPESSREDANATADRIRAAVARESIAVGDRAVRVSVSVGVAVYPGDARTREKLLTEAELAAEYAVLQGGDRVCGVDDLPTGFRSAPLGVTEPAEAAPVTEPLAPDRLVRATFEPLASARPGTDRLLVGVGAVALVAAVLSIAIVPAPMVLTVTLLFAGLAVGAEWFAESIYGRANSSWSAVPLIALAIHPETSPFAIAVAAVLAGVGGGLLRGVRVRQLVYNSAVLLLSTLAAWLVAQPLLELRGTSLLGAAAVGAVAGATFFVVDTALVSTAIARSERTSPFAVWRDDLLWLVPHQLGMGLLGGAMAYTHETLATGGTLVLVLPALALHIAQRQFVRRTREHVVELRNLNDEMNDANRRVVRVNQRLTDALEQVNAGYLVTVESLAAAVAQRDGYDAGHVDRVEAYGRRLLEAVHPELVHDEALLWGFRLHDIGKIGVPDRILAQPEPLEDDERELVERHPEVGAELIAAAPFLEGAQDVVLHHHERWDGRGYPSGLSAHAIPFTARLFAVVHAYVAMTSDRPYRPAMPVEEALQELLRAAGTQLDPEIVDAFLEIPVAELTRIREQLGRNRAPDRSRAGGTLIRVASPDEAGRWLVPTDVGSSSGAS